MNDQISDELRALRWRYARKVLRWLRMQKKMRRSRINKRRASTKRGRDAAVARHRAAQRANNPTSKARLNEALASLSKEEQAALIDNPHAITAVEKLLEKLLFRFSG